MFFLSMQDFLTIPSVLHSVCRCNFDQSKCTMHPVLGMQHRSDCQQSLALTRKKSVFCRLSEVDVHVMAQAFLAYSVLQFRPAGVMYLVNIHILYQIFFFNFKSYLKK